MANTLLAISNHGFMLGGGEHSFFELVCHLPGSWDVISTVPKDGKLAKKLRKEKIHTLTIPMPSIRPWSIAKFYTCLKNYFKICKIHNPQLIYANGPRAAIYGGIIGKILDLPVIWHCRIANSDFFLDKLLPILCDRIIVNSNATAKRFGPNIPPKIKVIYNGIDIAHFQEEPYQRVGFIDPEWKIILMVARVSRWKRHDLAIASFEKIAALDEKIHLFCIGNKDEHEPEWWERLQEMTRRSRFYDRIHWIGFVDDLRPWYYAAYLLLMPSENEPFGRVLVEAMACRLPVVGAKSGGIPEIVRNGQEGLLVTPGNAELFALAMEKVLKNDEYKNKLAQSAKKRALVFNLGIHIKKVLQVFEETIKR